MDKPIYKSKEMEKGKLSTEKKIELLKKAIEYRLTDETIQNIARQVICDLVKDERYEECAEIMKLEKSILKKLKIDKNEIVSNVGLSSEQTKKLFGLI